MASLVLGVVGGAVGFVVGGPVGAQVGFMLGSAAGGILFPPKGPDGARLNELTVQSSTYGKGIPIPYGSDRVAGNIIWADKIQEHANEHGGKGGPTYTTYSYTCSFASSICAGPIAGILRIWADGLLIYDRRPTATGEAVGFKASSYKIYLGDETQLPDPTIQAIIGATPAYRGQAYIVFSNLQLEKFGNRIPSLSFEYVTNGIAVAPVISTFGEKYGITPDAGQYDALSNADMDANGHIWLSTMTGHAVLDATTGKYVIDANSPPTPQLQEYDPVTKTMLWAYNVAPISELQNPDGPPDIVYPIKGTSVISGGYFFVARGYPGWVYDLANKGRPYVHGIAVNIQTHAVALLTDECSHSQFQNAFYWPSVPIPVIDNNKVYFASGNGLVKTLGVGFMPASIQGVGGSPDTDPVADRSGAEPLWNVPVGWAQSRAKNLPCPLPPNNNFDGVRLDLPDWASKSTVITNPAAVIVQGYNASGGSYLSWVGHTPYVAGFDLSPPSEKSYVLLPGNPTVMPPIAWDAKNGILWAFAGGETNNQLYSIIHGPGGITMTATDFAFPPVAGQATGNDVKSMVVDPDTGLMRIVIGGGSDPVRLMQFDPVAQAVTDEVSIAGAVAARPGKMWDYPAQGKVIFTNGYALYELPYAAPLTANPANLGAIVANISERAGLSLADIDVSELTDMVDGYTVTHQMAARSAVEALMPPYQFDVVESDWKVRFPKRGRQSIVSIPDDDLAAHSSGSAAPDLIQIKRKQELDLPQSVSVKYKNAAADYQTSVQYEARQTGRSNSTVTVDIPVVMSGEKAKQVAAASLYSAWAERNGISFATSIAYAKYEPTDVMTVHGRLVRIVHRKRSGGIIEWEGYQDSNTLFPSEVINQGGAPAPAGPVDQAIQATPPAQLFAIDAPITQAGTTTPSLTFAVQGTSTGFAGAQIWKSIDGGLSYAPLVNAPNASLIGSATTALGNWTGGDTFDEANTVTVSLLPSSTGATLSSASELSVLNGANAVLLGNEVLQYKRAVLNDNGTYTLSGLLRYRRGTDYATHTVGERFVPLTTSLVQIPVTTAEIGLPRQYKAVSSGGTLSQAQPITLTYTGADLKPYSPVHIGGWRDPAGDIILTWVRRTRVGGEWRDFVDVPLAESTEVYDVEILSGSTVVRTFSSVASPMVAYTAAQQVTDFGAMQSSVSARVFQLSSVVGRGFPGTGTV